MRKTSIYLPPALHEELATVASAQGRSQAHLVRLAIERLVAAERSPRALGAVSRHDDPTTRDQRPRGPALVGVGVGPGDPTQITLAAVQALRDADRVVAPCTSPEAVGRAESVVREVVPNAPVERAVFVMATDGAARDAALAATNDRIVECLDAGERVAFVTLGDPNVYSTFTSVLDGVRARRPRTPVEVLPGVMAFQVLAARTATPLVDGTEHLSLVTALDGAGDLGDETGDPTRAVVVYKGGRNLPALAARLDDLGRLEGALVGELLGLPGERIAPLAEVADRPATYLATVIVPPKPRAEARP